MSLASPALAGGFFTTSTIWEAAFLPMSVQLLQHHLLKRLKYRTLKKNHLVILHMNIDVKLHFLEVVFDSENPL